MSEYIVIRMDESADAIAAQWSIATGDGVTSVAGGTVADAADAAAGRRAILLAPAVDVLLTSATIPKQQKRHLRRLLPFALEEQVATDIEALHFAVGRSGATADETPVAVVARARIEQWLASLDEVGIKPVAIVPEPLALPWEAGSWSLLIEKGRALLRTDEAGGFALGLQELPLLTAKAMEQAQDDPPTRVRLWCGAEAGECDTAQQALESLGLEVERQDCDGGNAMTLLGATTAPSLNLLQGGYSPTEHISRLWRPWRTALALLAALIVVRAGMGIYRFHRLKAESEAMQQQIVQLYRRAFPGEHRVVDAKVQMQQGLDALRKSGGGSAFVKLLSAAAPVLHETKGVQIRGISFQGGKMMFNLQLGDMKSLDRLKRQLTEKAHLNAKIGAASSSNGEVTARIQVDSGGRE